MQVDGLTALVTGGASGLGRARRIATGRRSTATLVRHTVENPMPDGENDQIGRSDKDATHMKNTGRMDTAVIIDSFNEAFNSHDVDAIMALMTDDVVFDNTTPPDGERYEGQAEVRAFWENLFAVNPRAWFDTIEMFTSGDRCTARWLFTFDRDVPEKGHVHGVDVFKVRDGKVAEKLSYVKG